MSITILDGVSTEETEAVRWIKSIANPDAGVDLATEWDAVTSVALECLMTEKINPDGSVEMASLRRACSSKVRQRAGAKTRTIARMTMVYDPQNLASNVSKAYVALAEGEQGFIAIKRGIHLSEAATGGDLVTLYKVEVTQRIELQAADNDEFQFGVDIAVQDWYENVPILGAGGGGSSPA